MKKPHIRNCIVLPDIYLKYPHKTYDVTSSTVPYPYFPKEEITDNELSLTYKEWRAIIDDYFTLVRSEMAHGKTFDIPNNLGHIAPVKYRRKGINKSIDWLATNKAGSVRYRKNSDIFSRWATSFMWRKWEKFKFKVIWKLKVSKLTFREMGQAIRKDPSILNEIEG